MTKDILESRKLCKSYGQKSVLENVSITIPRGHIVGLLGANGAGKTTFIKLAVGLLTPTSGEIKIDGQNIGPESKSKVAYLPEQNPLDKNWTIEKILGFYNDMFPDFNIDRARELLQDLKLDTGEELKHMSKGMQEKVALALTMSREAKLYILDEPLGGVDPATRDYILDTILTNFSNDSESSLLISTHIISDIERILDDVIFIKNGKVILSANADELREKHQASIDEVFRKEFKNV